MKQYGTIFILTLSLLSCNDQSQYYYPNEIGIGRGTSQRYGIMMDSTIAGVPTVVGSEWVYADSFSINPSLWYHDTIRIRLTSVQWDSVNGSTYTYQELSRNQTDTLFFNIEGNILYSGNSFGIDTVLAGFIWGHHILYQFPLAVGKTWNQQFGKSWVVGKEKKTVKAGTFDTYVIKNSFLPPLFENSYRWYGPRIGVISVSDSILNFVYHAELLSYHIGPRRR
jgi:hypothetical protein